MFKLKEKMTKSRLDLRKVVAIAICLAGITVFSGCEKPEDDPKGKPSAVMNFTATAGNGQVSLLWDTPSNNGGSEVTGYEVTMDNWTNKVTKTPSERSHTYTGLNNGTKYTFKVRAVNAKGNGEEATATATPTADGGKLKSATIIYETNKGEKHWFCFDNYGTRWRWERADKDERTIILSDGFQWKLTSGWISLGGEIGGMMLTFTPDQGVFELYEGYVILGSATKTNETIAGQSCVVYKFTDGTEYGVWKNQVYLRKIESNGDQLNAITAREGYPENAFTQMVAIDW